MERGLDYLGHTAHDYFMFGVIVFWTTVLSAIIVAFIMPFKPQDHEHKRA